MVSVVCCGLARKWTSTSMVLDFRAEIVLPSTGRTKAAFLQNQVRPVPDYRYPRRLLMAVPALDFIAC
jgi:hypothetical protein